jgi:hypothetical protein
MNIVPIARMVQYLLASRKCSRNGCHRQDSGLPRGGSSADLSPDLFAQVQARAATTWRLPITPLRLFVLDAPVASLIPASAELPPEDVPLPEPEAENDRGERDQ